MLFKDLKNLINLFEKTGVADNVPVKTVFERTSGKKINNLEIFFNINEFQNGIPSKIEIRVKEKGVVPE